MNSPAKKLFPARPTDTGTAHDSKRLGLRVTAPTALSASDLFKSYFKGKLEVPVLRGVSLSIAEGEFTAVVGQSGSGKSTLLHLLGTLDKPDQGEIFVGERAVSQMTRGERDHLRNQDIGLIFQFYHLLPELTTLENVVIPHMIGHGFFSYFRNKRRFTERAKVLLEKVGLAHRFHHRPSELSGGEMQRASIARALMTQPSLLLADEPTGNLDSKNSDEVLSILFDLQAEENLTILMVTHDDEIARSANRTIRLVEGRVTN